MKHLRFFFAGIIGIVAVCIAAYVFFRYQHSAQVPVCTGCNVVLIAVDPLRADSLYRFGHFGSITPSLTGFSRQGVVFTNAFAVSSWTLPSAMSLLTSTYPSVHKIVNKDLLGKTAVQGLIPADLATASPNIKTLASVFKNSGYVTGGFAGGAALAPSFGFSEGFDSYESPGEFEGLPVVIPRALSFIKKNAGKPMFVFVHGFDTHGQYIPPGGLTKKYVSPSYHGTLTGSAQEQKALREQGVMNGDISLTPEDVTFLRAIYEEKVSDMDAEVGKFLAAYRKLSIKRKTIFIFTSDHGDEFYEHGRIDHGMTLYDEVLHVPLIIVVPGMNGGKILTDQVRNIDIMPTLLALTGITPSPSVKAQMEGVSLIPTMEGIHQHLDLFAETVYRYATSLVAIRTWDGWKFIFNRETSAGHLYHLTADPTEQKDIGNSDENSKAQELMSQLMQYVSRAQTRSGSPL